MARAQTTTTRKGRVNRSKRSSKETVKKRDVRTALSDELAAGTARPEQVAEWSHDLSDNYLLCRDLGHTWRPFNARWDPEQDGYIRVLRCSRCKTERSQLLSATGMVDSGSYDYPDGYQAPPGTGRLTGEGRGALRLESVMRLIDKNGR